MKQVVPLCHVVVIPVQYNDNQHYNTNALVAQLPQAEMKRKSMNDYATAFAKL